MLLHRHRARARTASAMRRRKRLVQIQVHHVDAEIARPRDAHQRVHVRAVHVDHARPWRAGSRATSRDVLLEHAQRVGIGDHQRGDIFIHRCAPALPGPPCRDRSTRCSPLRTRPCVAVAGLVPCAESGIRIFLRGLPSRFEQRADQQDAGQLAVRARGRLQRHRVHAGDLGQRASPASAMISIAPCDSDSG